MYSPQAERFMALFEKHLPNDASGIMLREWDKCYTLGSKAASLFHQIYREVLTLIFGKGMFGSEVWAYLENSTGLLPDFFPYFDKVAAGEVDVDVWFPDGDNEALYLEAIENIWKRDPENVAGWGEHQQVTMSNILFDGKMPKFLGFDYGPFPLPGCSATIVQAAAFQSAGRATSFFPSWRFISPLEKMEAHTVLAGGPSARRFSKLYKSEIAAWRNHEYKRISVD